ncbi:hypothetical protein [Streptomyces silvisoli]|uniref:Uncharacterized protein n=1 Tax=Streptomyces silvisoli TaxID=3034235 RepID=A0ABT5ZMM9_9ACTN|nr:hypothetical protein [Streptomyces silvisoli]MDF3291095.1 hypothetical protein [Streptomyces silvisoli]
MLPAALALPAAVVRPRTTAARRALQVALLLGGFLALAFVLSGQAHADSPDAVSLRYAGTPFGAVDEVAPAAPLHAVAQGAAQRFAAGAQQADRGVKDTVAAATSSVRPVTGLLGAVQDAAGQVTSPIAGATGAGHGDPGNPVSSAPRPLPHKAVPAHVGTAPAARPTASVAGRYPAGAAHRAAAHPAHQRRDGRAPAQLPFPAGHSGHPGEGDGSTHHTGDAHAALFADGARFHLGADVPRPANGSSPSRRSTDVSVQPD